MRIYLFLLLLPVFTANSAGAQANRYDVVIDEIMVDPAPQVGLPNAEWIELRNTSTTTINLAGWRIAKAGTQSGPLPGFILQPDSMVIICAASALPAMSAFGRALSVTSFPSLNNDADLIYLRSADNKVIHAVSYGDAWYKNELKREGGWTLEMIDTKNACSGNTNWSAATDARGGTPGKINSLDGANPDNSPPRLLRAYAIDSTRVALVFDEPLDSLKATSAVSYAISDGIGAPVSVTALLPTFHQVELNLPAALLRDKVYTVTTTAVTDCAGNAVNAYNTARVGLTSPADSLDVVINEILFNPGSDGVDYVEIYNRSTGILDLKDLYIANRNSAGAISAIQRLSPETLLIFPGDFIVITTDIVVVQRKYVTTNPNAFVQLPSMPSFPNDKGDVIILNAQGRIVDEVVYTDKWHFQLVTNTEGVSLERIDYNGPSLSSNFHSSATSVGHGTPGYKNSQFRADAGLGGAVSIAPKVFSPDNDGTDDFIFLNYNFPAPGYVANIIIFDAAGRPVRYLQRNALCGLKGTFQWDGLGEKQQKLPVGMYIFFTEIFSTAGEKKQFKNTAVLARRR